MTDLIMAYSYATDVFALALLLSSIGAFAVIRLSGGMGVALGSICFAMSMGLYQSYILFGGLILVSCEMLWAMDDRHLFTHRCLHWIKCVVTAMTTAIVYWIMYRYFMWSYGTGMASANVYNSPARLFSTNLMELVPLFGEAYRSFLEYFFGMGSNGLNLIQTATLALSILTGVLLAVYAVKEKLPFMNLALLILGIVLFPGIAQVISVLSGHGRIYFLTVHALYLMYPLLIGMIQRIRFSAGNGRQLCPLNYCGIRIGVLVLCGAVLFGNISFSNEMYTFREVQYDKTVSYVTRLMERIDSVPGYVRNETEVVFAGYMSAKLSNLEEPEGTEWMNGINGTAITYLQVLRAFIHMLGEEMNIPLDYSHMPDYWGMEEVRAMPAFPNPGCSMMIDDRVLVKLSDY